MSLKRVCGSAGDRFGKFQLPESRTISFLNQDAASGNTVQEIIRDDEDFESDKSDESKRSADEEFDRPAKRRKVKLEDSQCPWCCQCPAEFAELPPAIRKTTNWIILPWTQKLLFMTSSRPLVVHFSLQPNGSFYGRTA